MINEIEGIVKKEFEFYGYKFYEKDKVTFLIEEHKIIHKTFTNEIVSFLSEDLSVYDLYVSWKEKGWI